MASLDQLKDIRQGYQDNVDALGAQVREPHNGVEIESANDSKFSTESSTNLKDIEAANATKESAKVQARMSRTNEEQLSAAQEQRQLMEKQLGIQNQQNNSIKALHDTMQSMLQLMVDEQKKLSPKVQQFGANKADDEYTGEAKDGMIDKMGGALSDLMGWGDRRRGRDRGDRGRDRGDRNRKRPGGNRTSRIRRGLGGALDTVRNQGGRAVNAANRSWGRMPRGGKAAVITGVLAGLGAGAYSLFGGSDDDPDMNVADAARIQRTTNPHVNQPRTSVNNGTWQDSPQAGSWAGDTVVSNSTHYTTDRYSGLGSISAEEESGGKSGTVSTGRGDHGGVSYGKHQLSSKSGTMQRFLNSKEGQPFAPHFNGTEPGSALFSAKFKELSARDPRFDEAQAAYIKRTHYDPQVKKVSKSTNSDLGKRGRAVQEMLYSTGVQYGPNSSIIVNALKGKNVNGMSDAEIIMTVQSYKQQTVGQYFKSSSASVQQSVANRAQREGTKLLALNARDIEGESAEKQQVTGTGQPEVEVTQSSAPMTLASATTIPESELPGAGPGVVVAGTAGAAALAVPLIARSPGTAAPAASPAKPTTSPSAAPPAATSPTVAPVKPETAPKATAPKGRMPSMGKAVPVLGTALTVAEAASIMTDDTMSKDEKVAAGTELAGGTAGAVVGGKAGAAVGGAIGAAFFGVGAIPGAVIGGAIGSVGGYLAGSYGARAVHDAVAGEPEAMPEPQVNAAKVDEVMKSSGVEASAAKAVTNALKPPSSTPSVATSAAPPLAVPLIANGGANLMPAAANDSSNFAPSTAGADVAASGMAAAMVSAGMPAEWAAMLQADYSKLTATPEPVVSVMSTSSAPVSSPANREFYSDEVAVHAPSAAAPSSPIVAQASPVAASSPTVDSAQPQASEVSSRAHADPVHREPHTPVKSVIALNVKEQNTMMPDRFKPAGDRIPSRGISNANSSRQTIDDCPVVISDGGLILLQTGFI